MFRRLSHLIPILFINCLLLNNAVAQTNDIVTLDRNGWSAVSSTNNQTSNAFDNNSGAADVNTRWATNSKQTPGQFFTINLGGRFELESMTMVSKSEFQGQFDYPRSYEVRLSNDGVNFGPVIHRGQGNPTGSTQIPLAGQAQYVKITQTGNDDFYWWSIHDLQIQAKSGSTPGNQPPSVSFISPTPNDGDNINIAVPINVAVDATDTDGTVESVALFVDNNIISQKSEPPFEWNSSDHIQLSGLQAGTHQLKAEATDNAGAITSIISNFLLMSDEVENQLPSASFASPSPTNGQQILKGSDINIAIVANDADGSIAAVQLKLNDQTIGTLNTAPFLWGSDNTAALANLSVGNYALSARITDDQGGTTSISRQFSIVNDNNDANLPSGDFISPTPEQNAQVDQNQALFVEVSASDTDGTISNVRLFIDGQFVRQENVAPYEWNSQRDGQLANLSQGAHTFRADITDNDGNTTQVTRTFSIDVEEPGNTAPKLGFIPPTPAQSSTLKEGDSVNIAVTASDDDDNLVSVSLNLNGNLISTKTQAPFIWNSSDIDSLSSLSEGTYTIVASATDTEGLNTELSRTFLVTTDLPNETACTVTGDLTQWHRVAVICDGPIGDENNDSTFTNNRFNMTFSNGNKSIVVPGHFAADGNAADTSANSGNKWRVYFSPPESGNWNYLASFRTGSNIAVSNNASEGSPVSNIDGANGQFSIAASGSITRDMRTRGLLQHKPGETRLRFAGSNDIFVQGGVDSPENIFGYDEFDNTTKFFNRGSCKGILHSFDPHEQDWNSGDPTWKNGQGKSLIGLVNYIASTGANSFYIMMNTVNGDGCDAHPWTNYNDNGNEKSFDVSKLDQWERVLSHMTAKGLLIHAMTQETENDGLLGRDLRLERKLFYRELISRFGHHPALLWNLGEENNSSTEQLIDYADFIKTVDPYDHPIHVHNKPNDRESKFAPLLGAQNFDGPTIQISTINDSGDMYNEIQNWIQRSIQANNPWVVTLTEASGGNAPFPFDNVNATQRLYWMWASVMSGGGGFEWYLKGQNQGHALDLAVENLREFDAFWQQSGHLVTFFRDLVQRDNNIDLQKLSIRNNAVSGNNDWVLGDPGSAYIVVLKEGGQANLSLPDSNNYEVTWFNPRNGNVSSGGIVTSTGSVAPPNESNQDWVLLLTVTQATVGGDLHPDIVSVLDRPLDEILRAPGGAGWADSYSVDDQCYCETTFDHNIGPVVVDTPVGQMTVREACELIGDGPGSNGRPKYNDIQCGNGPANDAGDEDWCPGRVDLQGTEDERKLGCNQIGPVWKF